MILRHYSYTLDYEMPVAYALLLADRTRVDAYVRAIDEVTRPTDTVVELGSGPGMFGRYASDKCTKVILVETSQAGISIAGILNELLCPADNTKIIERLIEEVELPPCDVVIHELIGGRVLDEGLRSIMSNFAINNAWFNHEHVKIIPASIEVWLKLVEIDEQKVTHEWDTPNTKRPHNEERSEILRWVTSVNDFCDCSDWYKLIELDSKYITEWPEIVEMTRVNVNRHKANAVLWGFVAKLTTDIHLDARLGLSTPTTWGGTIELLDNAPIAMGEHNIEVELGVSPETKIDTGRWIRKIEAISKYQRFARKKAFSI